MIFYLLLGSRSSRQRPSESGASSGSNGSITDNRHIEDAIKYLTNAGIDIDSL